MTNTPMSRIAYADMPDDIKPAWEALNRLTGDASFVEVFAQAPELIRFVMGEFYMKIFFGGRLDNKFKQLARLRLSTVHGCQTCNRQNVPGSLEAGISQEQVDALGAYETGPFTPAEKAVLRFADQMLLTNPGGKLDADLHADLRQHFSDAQICELAVVCGVIGGMFKASLVLDLVVTEDYCPFVAKPEQIAAE
jgi:alkylhydroperoxidase family enzyme